MNKKKVENTLELFGAHLYSMAQFYALKHVWPWPHQESSGSLAPGVINTMEESLLYLPRIIITKADASSKLRYHRGFWLLAKYKQGDSQFAISPKSSEFKFISSAF